MNWLQQGAKGCLSLLKKGVNRMKKIIFATKNVGKFNEFTKLMEKYDLEVLSLLDLNYEAEIEENGVTFEENALIKARTIAEHYNFTVIADDSGLIVDALNGAPGVDSAIYAGAHASDDANMDKVLAALKDVAASKRSAQFICVLAIVDENGKETVVTGQCKGEILFEKRGLEGFGYDPIFYLPELGKTMAELSKDEKNALSHRANAFKKFELVAGEIL